MAGKSWEEVWDEFTKRNRSLESTISHVASTMTPIEKITLVVLYELQLHFGLHHFNMRWQERIGKYTADFIVVYHPIHDLVPQKKIVIECDGHDFHEKTKQQAAKDKERDRFFAKEGYTVLRYTGSEIFNDRYKVYTDVEEILIPDEQRESFGYGPKYAK